MERDTISYACKMGGEHGDRSTLVADVIVNMIDCIPPNDVGGQHSFNEIDELVDQPLESRP